MVTFLHQNLIQKQSSRLALNTPKQEKEYQSLQAN
jgi:hypothetical protein